NIAKQLRLVLGPAIDAARAALRDLDDEDVPGRLRAIAKQGDSFFFVSENGGIYKVNKAIFQESLK
ncbi:MAG: hypothetical protein GY765_24850, partial [bacterium]|nr:hypothetical protein [bacterium]